MKQIIKEFTKTLPAVDLAFAYGSAVQPQKGYDYAKQKPMVDLILSVESCQSWHKENLKSNPKHYSGLSYFVGSPFIHYMNVNIFPIHFSPFIKHNDMTVKYGVIQSNQLFKDLESWRWLTLAGRMHKPILEIEQNFKQLNAHRYNQAYQKNLEAAVVVAILLDFKEVYEIDELLYTVMSLSYHGDIRFTMGGENQNKVANILTGNFEAILNLYLDMIEKSKDLNKILKIDDGKVYVDNSKIENLLSLIPLGLAEEFMGEGKNIYESYRMMDMQSRQQVLKHTLKIKNKFASKRMLLSHLISISPFLNAKYALKKLNKRWGIFK